MTKFELSVSYSHSFADDPLMLQMLLVIADALWHAGIPPVPLLVTLHCPASATEFVTATRELYVGCVKSSPGFVRKVSSHYSHLFCSLFVYLVIFKIFINICIEKVHLSRFALDLSVTYVVWSTEMGWYWPLTAATSRLHWPIWYVIHRPILC